MSNNEQTQLAKIIEFLHRRGVIGPNRVKDHRCNIGLELAQLAYGSNWDVDDFMKNGCRGNDYGFDPKDYLFSHLEEICQEEHLQVANKVNTRIFKFQGDFTLPENYIPKDEEYTQEDYTGEYTPEL